jgi:hypothetical protein
MIHAKEVQWKRYMERLDAYRTFLADAGYDHLLQDPERLIYTARREVNGVRVGIAGFNSAWSCARDGENGKLWLAGRWQAEHLLADIDDVDVSMALVHHPSGWYVPQERNDFWRHALQSRFHVCLHGHEHDAWVDLNTKGHLAIAAAACYERSDLPNGYNVVRLDPEKARGEVWLRQYTRAGGGGWRACVIPGHTNDRGVWILPEVPWLRAWRPHVAGEEPTADVGVDEVHQFRAEERARQRIEELRQVTAWQTQEEIRKVAQRKYIPSLYIKRHTEDLLNYWLFTDETLSAELARQREAVHATLTAIQERGRLRLDAIETELHEIRKGIRQFTHPAKAAGSDDVGEGDLMRGDSDLASPVVIGLQARDDSRPAKGGRKRSAIAAQDEQLQELRVRQGSLRKEKAHLTEILRQLEQASAPLEGLFELALADGRPCDGGRSEIFARLMDKMSLIYKISFSDNTIMNLTTSEFVSANARDVLSSAAVLARSCRFHVKAVIDRAGGGKTNILCHMAIARSHTEPSLFLAGRLTLEDPEELLNAILKRLGVAWLPPGDGWVAALDEELRRARSHLTVFLDGINENRDLTLLNEALNQTLTRLAATRVRFVVTCRDLYWVFFEDQPWRQLAGDVISRELYEFSDEEQALALDAYLRHFKIAVSLGTDARQKCRHPLLLRFFCEAYSRPDGEVAHLGHIEEIRIKPLFDDYWRNKMEQVRAAVDDPTAPSPENCLFAVVRSMFDTRKAEVTIGQFQKVTGVGDLKSPSSVYLTLLSEDIIIEETPTDRSDQRRICFVYEEFMEYVLARELFQRAVRPGRDRVESVFAQLDGAMSSFVNALGVGEYLVAFCLDERLYRSAFEIVVRMGEVKSAWREIIANIFKKYDQSIEMILESDFKDVDVAARRVEALLMSLGGQSRPTLVDLCVAIGLWVAFPRVLKLEDIRSSKVLPPHVGFAPITSGIRDPAGLPFLKAVARSFLRFQVNPVRNVYWKEIAAKRPGESVDLRELVRALWNLVGTSPRRSLLESYACNGLFDPQPAIRLVAAHITRNASSQVVKQIRALVRTREAQQEVLELLR